jgi:hypothetical protein
MVLCGHEINGNDSCWGHGEKVERAIAAAGHAQDEIVCCDLESSVLRPPVFVD